MHHSQAPSTKSNFFLSDEIKVIAAVLVSLLVTESAMRLASSKLSKDVVHLQEFDQIVHRLDRVDDHAKRILVVGNSLVREGIPTGMMAEVASHSLERPVYAESIHPDNTAFAEWYYAIRHFLLDRDRHADVIVIGFQGAHLRDAPSRHAEQLARYYCGSEELQDLAAFDLRSVEDWAHYGTGWASESIANRERVERRVLDQMIPQYRFGIQELNRRSSSPTTREPTVTYQRLRKLIGLLREHQIAIVLAEMPIQTPNPVDPELTELAREERIQLIRADQFPALPVNLYADALHLNPRGAEVYGRELANAIDWHGL